MKINSVLDNILKQIHQNQKGFNVQTSIHLQKIQQYIFDPKNAQKLTQSDIQALFSGYVHQKQKIMGLFALCGTQKSLIGGLKKSAYYALQLLYKSVSTGKAKQLFLKVFQQADQQDFKVMRLAAHILDEKSQTALKLCAIIKSKRPYLPQTDYIFSDQARKKFAKFWAVEQKKVKKKDVQRIQTRQKSIRAQMQQTTNSVIKHSIKKNKNGSEIESNLQTLQFYDDYLMQDQNSVYVDTFLDPIDVFRFKKNLKEQRVKNSFKQYMTFIVQTPMTTVQRGLIQDCARLIHIQSDSFDPNYLLKQFHSYMSQQEKIQICKTIPKSFGKNYEINLLKYYFPQLVQLQQSVSNIKQSLVHVEKLKNQSNIGFSLRTKVRNSMSSLQKNVIPLSEKYNDSQKLRNVILFLEKNGEFLKLPSTIEAFLQQNNINQILKLFIKYENLIRTYKKTPIIKKIVYEVNVKINETKIKQLKKTMQKYDHSQAELLLGLFVNKKQILVTYIIPKLIESIYQQIGLGKNQKQIQKIQQIKIKTKNFEMNYFYQIIFCPKINIIQEDQGDMLESFLIQTKNQNNISVWFQNFKKQNRQKISNLLSLVDKWNKQYSLNQKQKIYFDLLLNSLLYQYMHLFKQIQEKKLQQFIQPSCEIILMIQNYCRTPQLMKCIQKQKQKNFDSFCQTIQRKTKSKIQFLASTVRKDDDGNYYNSLIVNLMQSIVQDSQKITKYKSFQYGGDYQKRFYQYVLNCLKMKQSLLTGLPQLLSYAAMFTCLLDGKFMKPFYYELKRFKHLKSKMDANFLKGKINQIKNLAYHHIKINYSAILVKNKRSIFALQIMDVLRDYIYLVAQHARNMYKQMSRFMLEAFLYQTKEIIQKNNDLQKRFYIQLQVIRSMTTKVTGSSIQKRWNQILSHSQQLTQDEKDYIIATKTKNLNNYRALILF